MTDLSARGLLECFHRYLDSEARSVEEVAPNVYRFCGAQARAGSSAIDVACGTYRHAGGDYEVVAGQLLSIDGGITDAHDVAFRRLLEHADGDRRFELCGTQPEPRAVSW